MTDAHSYSAVAGVCVGPVTDPTTGRGCTIVDAARRLVGDFCVRCEASWNWFALIPVGILTCRVLMNAKDVDRSFIHTCFLRKPPPPEKLLSIPPTEMNLRP